MNFSKLSIKWKLTTVAFLVTVIALSTFLGGLIWATAFKLRTKLTSNTAPVAEMVRQQVGSAMERGDAESVRAVLKSLHVFDTIAAAAVYNPDGTVFARYPPDADVPVLDSMPVEAVQTNSGDEALLFHRMTGGEGPGGGVFFRVRLKQAQKYLEFLGKVSWLCLLAAIAAAALGWILQGIVLRPIDRLVEAASRVAEEGDYSIRVGIGSGDEIGRLGRAFNAMLDTLQARNRELDGTRGELQEKVEDLRREVEQRREAEGRLRESRKRLTLALDGGGIGTWNWELETGRVECDERMRTVCGLRRNSFGGRYEDLMRLVHPDDREAVDQALQQGRADEKPWSVEFRVVTPNIGTRDLSMRGMIWHRNSGEAVRMVGVCWDMTEQHRREQEIRHAGERARVIVEATSAVVWSASPDGRMEPGQQSWAAYTGQRAADYQASSGWLSAFHPDDQASASQQWEIALRDETSYEIEARIWSREHAHHRYCIIHAEPCRGSGGEIIEWSGTIVDVHDRRCTEEDLRNLAAELGRSNQDLEEFAYIASHDLRAPLRAIASLADWLEEDLYEVLQPDNRRQLDMLRGRVARLERLIEDLLQYSRAGRLCEDADEVDVKAMIEDIVQMLNLPLGFRVETRAAMPFFATAVTPLHQVFQNLIGNAVKHHDRNEGHIVIGVQSGGEMFEFSVSDDGPGIPADMQERAFRVFQTLRPRDEVEGSGIGLALVKRIVERYGGEVRLESEGRGCTVRFTWPKEAAHHEHRDIQSGELVAHRG